MKQLYPRATAVAGDDEEDQQHGAAPPEVATWEYRGDDGSCVVRQEGERRRRGEVREERVTWGPGEIDRRDGPPQ